MSTFRKLTAEIKELRGQKEMLLVALNAAEPFVPVDDPVWETVYQAQKTTA